MLFLGVMLDGEELNSYGKCDMFLFILMYLFFLMNI